MQYWWCVGELHHPRACRTHGNNAAQGVIGTGLFLGTATSLSEGGPVGLLLGYMTIGSLCYCTMVRPYFKFGT